MTTRAFEAKSKVLSSRTTKNALNKINQSNENKAKTNKATGLKIYVHCFELRDSMQRTVIPSATIPVIFTSLYHYVLYIATTYYTLSL